MEKVISTDAKPVVSPNLHKLDEDGLCFLLDPERPAWAVVNPMGKEVVSLCNGRHSVGDIARAICQRYDADFKIVREDIGCFIDDLSKSEIICFEKRTPQKALDYSVRLESLYLEITDSCNLRCAHCFVEAGQPKGDELTTDEIKRIIDDYSSAARGKLIVISGGEPLTREDCLGLLSHAVSRGLRVRLITNGTLIDQEVAKNLASLGIEIQVSLDGASAETNDKIRGSGSFQKIMRGIRSLLANGVSEKLFISVTPTKVNVWEISEMIRLLIELGVSTLHISPLNRIGRATSCWKNLELSTAEKVMFFDLLHQKSKEMGERIHVSGDFCNIFSTKLQRILVPPNAGCRAGADLTINSKGDIYPCNVFASIKEYCLGNIRENTFGQVYESETLKQLRGTFPLRLEKIEKCRNCMWKYFCGGGCAARSLCFYGTIWKEDDLCDVTQHLFKKLIFEIAREQGVSGEVRDTGQNRPIRG